VKWYFVNQNSGPTWTAVAPGDRLLRQLPCGTRAPPARKTSRRRNGPWWICRWRPKPRCCRWSAGRDPRRGTIYYAFTTRDPGRGSRGCVRVLQHWRGGVAERLKAAVLKTAGPQGLAGSNPASSATAAEVVPASGTQPGALFFCLPVDPCVFLRMIPYAFLREQP
jgi:hypothetical protein